MYEKILRLCEKNGINIAKLERDTDLGNGTIRRWKRGKATVEKVKRVADYFGVTVDSLIADHNLT